MFSIAAINENDSGGKCEPLAPTKEAQEFALSQKYHEGLLKLQQKDYAKAREFLEDVLKDPLISNIQADNIGSDQHLLQLRFLTLKNLASVFHQQGSEFYDNALHCYMQAVELDANDSVVWNHLGTLSCSMGLLSVSRWAFEQGLSCSPSNCNCMEKLLEVLIAIRDEGACLSVANLILKSWPSHHRALHVKKTIEYAEPVPFSPRGVDTLEPKHVKLNFSNKRKSIDDEMHQETRTKKSKQNATLQLKEAKWMTLLDGILSLLSGNIKKADEDNLLWNLQPYHNHTDSSTDGSIDGFAYNVIDIVVSTEVFNTVESAGGNGNDSYHNGESVPSYDCKTAAKEKEVNSDREHLHERRSTRLERLRSRKSGKDENESSGKDIAHAMTQFLDPFVLKGQSVTEKADCSANADTSNPDTLNYTTDHETNDIKRFLSKISRNFGPCHIGYMLLEEISHLKIPFQDYFVRFSELDKLTRGWAQDRSVLCSLFLAELYYDRALCSGNPSASSELSDSCYHICKIIESVALEMPFKTSVREEDSTRLDLVMDNSRAAVSSSDQNASHLLTIPEISDKTLSFNTPSTKKSDTNCAFWIRFFWLSGCLSLSEDSKEKAYKEFNIALSILRNSSKEKGSGEPILLPHTKLVKLLTTDRILCEINLIKLESLLWKNDENINKITHTEFMKLLPPLLLSTKDVCVGNAYGRPRQSEKFISLEFCALDILISACEKAKPMNIEVYLDSHRRKIQVLAMAAGMIGSTVSLKEKCLGDVDFVEAVNRNRLESVVEAVRDVSRNASKAKDFIDQYYHSDEQDGWSSLKSVIGDLQSLLLAIMCAAVKMILSKKLLCSGTSYQVDQLESSCLIDAAIAFCKLQHLDPTVAIKTQVELIVAVHDLLAEYGLCCAGKDGEGEEGTFLKFAIKHLMALDVKLKSQLNLNGMDEDVVPENDRAEDCTTEEPSVCGSKHNSEDKDDKESEHDEMQSCIDSALDQAFFCLYGLKINPDSCSEDDLAVHKNTSRGDYQTKEQCADVFQYILPYAKALSKTGLVKLRRVLRAIRKLFPQPPNDLLINNPIDNFLDGPDSCEKILSEIYESNESKEAILNVLFPGERGYEAFKKLSTTSSEPYSDVYGNLYYYIAQAEDISPTDKYTGFVLKKEGEEFVEQNANLFKYDLLYNPLRYESWKKLSDLYDEEVDLLLNDGSKHISILDWRTNTSLIQRVEMGRRHSRRCLLMSLQLAKTASQQSEVHEMLALVYYDSLQNVVPSYDQRATLPVKDSTWETFCQNSMKHFEKAFELNEQWLHPFYLGKLCEKLGHSAAKAFSYYNKAMALNPTAVDPVYRIHASRLKLLYTLGKQNLEAIQVLADYTYKQSTKEIVLSMLESITNVHLSSSDDNKESAPESKMENKIVDSDLLDKVWHILYDDCLYALGTCVEGDLKHFHKVRYKLAQGLHKRGEVGDLERAKEELSFCFKSSRSSFTVNMWEIDGTARKGRRKNPNVGGSRKNLEVSLSESSRKFITCIRKYMLLYLNLLERNRDLWTLEKAYTYLRTDKRFALCLGDIVPVGLGKYLQVLTEAIRIPEVRQASGDASVEQLLEKMFSVFMDHANLWADISTLPEVNNPELSESNLYSYIHQYIHLLESDVRLDVLEGLNEKIRKRFKMPKLSNSNFAKICKHASLAWCRCILIKLASITPLLDSMDATDQPAPLSNGLQLFIDLQPDELLISSPDGPSQFKGLDMNWFETFNRIKNIPIKQTSEDNMETAVTVMKSTYNLYRESSCGTFPSGINLYRVTPAQAPVEGLSQGPNVVDILDLSIPRKLLLWAYTLVHGHYANISSVVKYCDEMKSRNKRGTSTATTSPVMQPMAHITISSQAKEKSTQVESNEAAHVATLAAAHLNSSTEAGGGSTLQTTIDAQNSTAVASQLIRSSSSRAMENA